MSPCIYTCMYTYLYVYIYIYVCTYTSMYVYTYIYIYVYIYINIYRYRRMEILEMIYIHASNLVTNHSSLRHMKDKSVFLCVNLLCACMYV